MLRVFVALGKQMPKDKTMVEDTQEVARLLAKYNCTMVQGGARMGLMGVVVDGFEKYSDQIVMIVPEMYKSDLEGININEYYIVDGESDRMKITIRTCDMMVVLPGGSGTLAELAYYNETCKSGEHQAKVVIVNSKGFYNKLFKFHKHQIKAGFMTEDACKYEVINSAKQLEPILQALIAEKQEQINKQKVKEQADIEEKKSVKPTKATKTSVSKAKTSKKESKKATTKVKEQGGAKAVSKSKPVAEKVTKPVVKKLVKQVEPKVEKPATKVATKTVAKKEIKPAKKVVAKTTISNTTKKAAKPVEKTVKPATKKAVKTEVKAVKPEVKKAVKPATKTSKPSTAKAKSATAKSAKSVAKKK